MRVAPFEEERGDDMIDTKGIRQEEMLWLMINVIAILRCY